MGKKCKEVEKMMSEVKREVKARDSDIKNLQKELK